MPLRVLDTNHPDIYPNMRLQARTSIPNSEPKVYTVLSYYWGDDEEAIASQVTTTEANVEQHEAWILLRTLPQTVRDAVDVTRKLAIRYLWIDALCIF